MAKRALAGVFVEALEAERDSINQRFRFANVHGPNIEPGALFDFLTICVDPVVASAARVIPERVRPLVRELVEISFALFSSHLLSNERRSPRLERLWREVLAKVPLLVATQPNLVAGRLNNALANIESHPGARPDEWLALLAVAAPTLESSERLFQASTVAAWMSGMAQYRSAAVKQLQAPPGLALARHLLQDSELDEKTWGEHAEQMADDPWLSLALGQYDARLNQEAQLAARLVRSYATDWLGGAGRFACLCLSYVVEDQETTQRDFKSWCDTVAAGQGGIPNGLAELDGDELDGVIHPAEDPELNGIGEPVETITEPGQGGRVRGEESGRKSIKDFRDPFEYAEVLKAAGVDLDPRVIAARYYRERATPHLIPFPMRQVTTATDPLPEGLDVWDTSDPLDDVDWLGTLTASPTVIPGVTTRQRLTGSSPGHEPEKTPFDLYLGIDCSGSMGDPAVRLSYPVLAGAIMLLSALRVGAQVKVVLSGEPGSSVSTDGFIRDAETCLKTLTSYLGTGYAFGIHRLGETFTDDFRSRRPVHILVISDNDMFTMLDEKGSGRIGWDVAREAVQRSGGGATYVLRLHPHFRDKGSAYAHPYLDRMQADGWNVGIVSTMEELVAFARQFSRQSFHEARR